MKKLFTFLAGAALLGSLSACSSDEPAKGQDGPNTPTGDGAYLSVKISSVGDGMSRTTDDGGFNDSNDTEKEHKVNHAQFFFFDENGVFVLEGKTPNGLTFTEATGDEQGTDQNNIEYLDKEGVIVLDKLTEKGTYPSYMLTVLNAPDFEAGATLTATLSKLSDYNNNLTVNGKETESFVMSTTSYYTNGANDDTFHQDEFGEADKVACYFATYIPQDNYQKSMDDALKTKPVEVFVERLAAKVQVLIDATPATPAEGTSLDYPIYKLTQTLGGGENVGGNVINADLYIQVLGWDLSATLPQSYMFKNIQNWNLAWTPWNEATRHRSYWAKSIIYGTDDYSKIEYITNEFEDKITDGISLNNVIGSGVDYCNEHTNIPENIFSNYTTEDQSVPNVVNALVDPRYVTHAVLHTRVCDNTGKDVDLVRAGTVLYTRDGYLKYIINSIDNAQGLLNLYTKIAGTPAEDGTVTNDYPQIGTEFFKLEPVTDSKRVGATQVNVNEDLFNSTPLYSKSGDKYDELIGEAKKEALDNLKSQLTKVQPTNDDQRAIIYDGGHQVYYIPIEHLGASATQTAAVEGYYGVVRNHWYKLTITEFSKVGHGIWKPENHKETLKPEGPEDPLYYLGAKINILSWKIVNQSVKL